MLERQRPGHRHDPASAGGRTAAHLADQTLYACAIGRPGANGKWELTFADSSVADGDRVNDQRQVIKVKAVTGPDEAVLSSYLHFRAPKIDRDVWDARPAISISMDELADLHCRMTPDRDAIEVQASVFVESNAEPYAEMTWHTRLERTAGAD